MIHRLLLALLALTVLTSSAGWAQNAFRSSGPTVSLAATGTTGRVQIQAAQTTQHVRAYNAGTVAVFIECGDVTVVATTAASLPVAPGTVEVLGCNTHVAGITASGSATLYLTPGSGL